MDFQKNKWLPDNLFLKVELMKNKTKQKVELKLLHLFYEESIFLLHSFK
jgi:hypothetical protein